MTRLSPAVHVVLGGDGAALARLAAPAPWEANAPRRRVLDHVELEFLVLLRAAPSLDEAQTLVDEADLPRLIQLVEVLQEFGLIADGAAIDPGPIASPTSAPTSPASGDDEPGGGGDEAVALRVPIPLRVTPVGYEVVDHDGSLALTMTPIQVAAATSFGQSATPEEAFDAHRGAAGDRALERPAFTRLVSALLAAGLLVPGHDPMLEEGSAEERMRRGIIDLASLRTTANEAHARHDAEVSSTTNPSEHPRVAVVPIQSAGIVPTLSTGMVLAYLRSYEGGELSDNYDLYPRWTTVAADAPMTPGVPTIFLFSNYLWSHEYHLELSREIKGRDPLAITIHGGPDCPSYPDDIEAYLRNNPHVDIAVRGEGERTAAEALAALAAAGFPTTDGHLDLSPLMAIPGLAFRRGDEVVRTDDRERITDLDTIPSPYLTGLFDVFAARGEIPMAIIETNRGCPYGCTFCDWGSATNSRIRKFDLERVLAEFQWCAEHRVARVFIADANFGIFPRDIEIARRVADLKRTHGYPKLVATNYAKNTVKHLKEIVAVLADAGILTEGLVSLQSMDEQTLSAIRRSNIKLEKYEALTAEFHESRLPLFVDLMMGLPGQTLAAFTEDLQQCVDREVNAKCHLTELLVNSPMNDPAYRAEHDLGVTRPPGPTGKGPLAAVGIGPSLVVSSATFTREDYWEMHRTARSFLLAENLGTLRQVSRFVRQESGQRELELLGQIRRTATADPDRWPYLAMLMNSVPETMAPPVSWGLLIDELRTYLITEVGVRPGSDLETVLLVQHAVLPSPDRVFPQVLQLRHDFAGWHRAMIEAKLAGHLQDWPDRVPRLRTWGPGRFEVDDPSELCARHLATGAATDAYRDWELGSPIARAVPSRHAVA